MLQNDEVSRCKRTSKFRTTCTLVSTFPSLPCKETADFQYPLFQLLFAILSITPILLRPDHRSTQGGQGTGDTIFH